MPIVSLDTLKSAYDYLIVGSGPAGCVLGQQLQRTGTVLVIEAGSALQGPLSRTPAYYPRSFGSRIDWDYCTEPQPQLANRRVRWPAGKTIGGSSAINAMIRIEPADSCLDELETIGGSQWSKPSVRSSFDELRSFWAGTLPELHPNTSVLLQHAIELGLGDPHGLWAPSSSVSPYVRMQVQGRRRSTRDLLKCDVLTEAFVRRLAISSDRIEGVQVDTVNESIELRARKQVMLCCGTIQTPRLLFQSGIGPREALQRAGLDCRYHQDRIGSGLQDHLIYPMVFRIREGKPFSWPFERSDRLRYLHDRGGPKSSNLAELGAFIHPHGVATDSFQWHITPTHYLGYPRIPNSQACISVGISLCKPKSSGWILPDRIDPQYLSDPSDWQAYLQAIEWTRDFFQSRTWQNLIDEEIAPGAKRTSHAAIRNHFERFATTLYHYSGTCSMGIDPIHPVDPQLKLRGFEGLRICDASVLPKILGCNPQTTVMMLAMRLAHWLHEES
ncbi:MAG: GMC family oxidoreductase [Pirellula sp.]